MKIKRFVNIHIPISCCTLRCHYCYVTQHHLFNNLPSKIVFKPDFVRKSLSNKRLGGSCHLNLCADGETMLMPNLTEYVQVLLEEGHIISIVSNCTVTKAIDNLCNLTQQQKQHLFIKCSYHYLELKNKGLLSSFFRNVKKLHQNGISITIEITPNDELMSYVDDAIALCTKETGAPPHFTVARDERDARLPILTTLPRKDYEDFWGKFNSELFNFKFKMFGRKITEFCYAGDWFFNLDLYTGILRKCHCTPIIQNIYDDNEKPIKFSAIGNNCPESHCWNAHAMVAMGIIPEIDAPDYALLRDREDKNGEHWLSPEIKEAFSQKLYDNNAHYSIIRKLCTNWAYIRFRK